MSPRYIPSVRKKLLETSIEPVLAAVIDKLADIVDTNEAVGRFLVERDASEKEGHMPEHCIRRGMLAALGVELR